MQSAMLSLTLRTAIWREFWARPTLHSVAPVLALIGTMLSDENQARFASFVTPLICLPLAGVLAGRGHVQADPFWRGLGGPGWARVVGAALVHTLLFLAVLVLDGSYVSLLLIIYTSVSAARSLTGGTALILAPLFGLVWVAANYLLLRWFFRSLPMDASSIALFAWSSAAAVGSLLWEHRYGTWSTPGSARMRALKLVSLVTGLFLGTATILSAAPVGAYPVIGQSTGEDGTVLLLPNGRLDYLSPAVLWSDEATTPLGHRGASDGWLGPRGSVLLLQRATPWNSATFSLITREGRTRTCRSSASLRSDVWRVDGGGVLVQTREGLLRVDVDHPCDVLKPTALSGAWLGSEVVWSQGASLNIGGASVSLNGAEVTDIAQSGNSVYASAGGRLFLVSHSEVRPIGAADRLLPVPGGVCSFGDHTGCWNERQEYLGLGRYDSPLAIDLVWNRDQDQIRELSGKVLASLGSSYVSEPAYRLPSGEIYLRIDGELVRLARDGALATPSFH